MNRVVVWTALLATTVTITGCPIFPDETGCTANRDCADGYVCDLGSNRCVSTNPNGLACSNPQGCGINETCGTDGYCHSGDCSFWGCVQSYACNVSAGAWTCESVLGAGAMPGTGGSSFGGATATGGVGGAMPNTGGAAGSSTTGGAGGSSAGGVTAAAGTSAGGSSGSGAGGAGG